MLIRSDDEAIGMAGTIAKYVEEKKHVIKIVFSKGEKALPHMQEQHMKKARLKETKEASNMIGIKETIHFDLKDTQLKTEIQKPSIPKRIKELIKEYNPEKIYTLTKADPHPDHQAVNQIVLKVVDSFRKKYSVYGFEVWNIKNETHPAVYVDISNYMKQKLEYIKTFKSQRAYMFSLYFPAIIRAKQNGVKNNCKYAEKFYKLR